MFIDDICDGYPLLGDHKLAETTIFKIYDNAFQYANNARKMAKNTADTIATNFETGQTLKNTIVFPSLLPYDNMCISFKDFTIWYIQENGCLNDVTDAARAIYYCLIDKNVPQICKLALKATKTIKELDRIVRDSMAPIFCIVLEYPTLCGIDIKIEVKKTKLKAFAHEELMGDGLGILYRFLSILSCKNIRKKKIQPDKKIQKKRIKNKKHPLLEYYVLELKNISSNSQKLPAKDLWSNRIHFCRGHMKTYTKERPLFGSIVGNYWWAPHVRGKKDKGVIIKDYQMVK